jgi:hypothetical protein
MIASLANNRLAEFILRSVAAATLAGSASRSLFPKESAGKGATFTFCGTVRKVTRRHEARRLAMVFFNEWRSRPL